MNINIMKGWALVVIWSSLVCIISGHEEGCYSGANVTRPSSNYDLSECEWYQSNTCCYEGNNYVDLESIYNYISLVRESSIRQGCKDYLILNKCSECSPRTYSINIPCFDFCSIKNSCSEDDYCLLMDEVYNLSCEQFDEGIYGRLGKKCYGLPHDFCFNSGIGLMVGVMFVILMLGL
eukprot:TRINITY_DN10144_c0_g1_i1.p1 TRINITY_DN10144_c0_g1~~TRINITY_DN10144_c0_g1_i1.p1  ORF type:complete len:178 (-),score=18.20 TRINITY_DN10144_c0_g1_i1:28-561(-)